MANTADLIECAAKYAEWVHTDHDKLVPMIHPDHPVMESDARQAIAIAFKSLAALKCLTDLVGDVFSTEDQPCSMEPPRLTKDETAIVGPNNAGLYNEAEARWIGTEMLKIADVLRDKEP